VALVAQERKHISTYLGDRFLFAKEMAHVWFDKLEELETKAPGSIESLKKDLNENTLIGEYIGSDEH
jgi:hypothetical protein